ncbi:hypothetical protein NDU88_003153 [Pleurodeles waltl]|uniref:Uncharacterized protein n=1 Tax=Pleurodeles waltl TaxID=8319 RepID=A0AAV7PC56_PLEWA|nr:hypothetical protein NDU88_003153 [Pleurodeles waltl]
MLTGADAAGSNPVVFPRPANPEELPASKEGAGRMLRKPGKRHKNGEFQRRGAQRQGNPEERRRRSGRSKKAKSRRRNGAETAADQEAQREDSCHASGEGASRNRLRGGGGRLQGIGAGRQYCKTKEERGATYDPRVRSSRAGAEYRNTAQKNEKETGQCRRKKAKTERYDEERRDRQKNTLEKGQ